MKRMYVITNNNNETTKWSKQSRKKHDVFKRRRIQVMSKEIKRKVYRQVIFINVKID